MFLFLDVSIFFKTIVTIAHRSRCRHEGKRSKEKPKTMFALGLTPFCHSTDDVRNTATDAHWADIVKVNYSRGT
jgi:hypothetical protein